MALIAQARLSPMEVLNKIHMIETELGRKRTVRWGERTIDIDIIFYDSDIISIKDLIIPHPDMQNRYFVLRPLLDICPEFVHPVLKRTISELYDELLNTLNSPSDCGACPG
jgi:2-amino-4-hydroxy-6-hydroxymethyldihydropteridine diphosphokinase